jgi:hypothetical protein
MNTKEHPMIRVDTLKYEAAHGRKPRQPRQSRTSLWVFQIDDRPEPRYLRMRYGDAVEQAKAWAQYSITVLP